MNSHERTLYLDACSTLMIDPYCDLEVAHKMYRILIKKHHPDLGGSEEKSKQINLAYETFQKYRMAYTPEEKPRETFTQPQPNRHTPSSTRPHDLYVEVMGFDVNVSQLYRWHQQRSKKWMEKRQKQKR